MPAFGQSAEQSIKLGEQVVTESVCSMAQRCARIISVMVFKLKFDDVQTSSISKVGTTGSSIGC
jgi:hypothetical protein